MNYHQNRKFNISAQVSVAKKKSKTCIILRNFLCLILTIQVIVVSASAVQFDCPNDNNCSANMFSDVQKDAWYHLYIDYIISRSAMVSLSETEFGTSESITRGDFIFAMHKLWEIAYGYMNNGTSQQGYLGIDFPDVEYSSKYYDACAWASRYVIIRGYDDGRFGLNDYITREQLATIMYRFIMLLHGVGWDNVENLKVYNDFADISDYAYRAMGFMVWKKYYQGNEKQELMPRKSLSRAEACAILYRHFSVWESDSISMSSLPEGF